MLSAVLNPVNSSIVAVSLVPIGRALHAPASQTSLLVTALYVATAIGQPLTGRLIDRHGPRRLLLAGAAITGTAGVIGALAPSFGVLLGARVLLGLGTCAGYPAAMSLIRSEADRTGVDDPGPVLTVLAVSSQTIVVVGPPLGGLLIGAAGWRATLALNVPLAVALLVLGARRLPKATTAAGDRVASSGALAAVVRNRPLLRTYARQLLAGITLYGVLYGFSQWLQEGRGLSASTAGLLLLPLSLVAIAISAATGRSTAARRKLVVAGAVQAAAGLALLTLDAHSAIWLLVVLLAALGVPQGLANLANQATLYRQADPAHMGASAGLLRTAAYGGAIVASLVIGAVFGETADSAGLHELGAVLAGASLLLLALTVFDPALQGATAAAATSSSSAASRPDASSARSSIAS